MSKTKTNQPKKVTLKHLSGKHDIDMKSLRGILMDAWLIKKGARKVEKKKAKAIIHQYMGTGKVSAWALEHITGVSWSELFTYFALWLLATVSLIGLVNTFKKLDQQWPIGSNAPATISEFVREEAEVFNAAEIVDVQEDTWMVEGNENTEENIADMIAIPTEESHSAGIALPSELPKTWS